jgi:hypothetical protein
MLSRPRAALHAWPALLAASLLLVGTVSVPAAPAHADESSSARHSDGPGLVGWLAEGPSLLGGNTEVPSLLSRQPDQPPYVGWTALLPPIAGEFEPTSSDDCAAGRVPCVKASIREMERRLEPLLADCSHEAVFALAYLRTTQAFLESSQTAGFYRDPAFVNHEEVVFAEMYFNAYDAWSRGDTHLVPPAWLIAFRAADDRSVSGTGDLLLGINAHVNRDLPFTLATIGLVAPDGTSRKPDHDRVNLMLNGVMEPLLAEEAARLDPDMDPVRTPYGVGYTGLMQLLLTWREAAWRHAELLVNAPDAASRARVAEMIETSAALTGRAIVATTAYLPPLSSTVRRDLYCAAHADAGR